MLWSSANFCSISQNMHYKATLAAQQCKTNKVVWTWKDDWPPRELLHTKDRLPERVTIYFSVLFEENCPYINIRLLSEKPHPCNTYIQIHLHTPSRSAYIHTHVCRQMYMKLCNVNICIYTGRCLKSQRVYQLSNKSLAKTRTHIDIHTETYTLVWIQ